MISRNELKFLNSKPAFTPYPGDYYAKKALDALIEAYEFYCSEIMNKNYSLLLSNGKEIDFQIFCKNLAHLLGIDFNFIRSGKLTKTVFDTMGYDEISLLTSWEIIKGIADNADKIIENDRKATTDKLINYYKVMIKCMAFKAFQNLEQLRFGVIDFDKPIYEEKSNISFLPKSSVFLFTQSGELLVPYYMLGLRAEENIYITETLIAPTNFPDFLRSQILLLPVQLTTIKGANLEKRIISSEEKIHLLEMYNSLISTHRTNSYIDIFNDYQNVLFESSKEEKAKKYAKKME